MSTTLITTVQGIGLGVMGQALAEHVPEISCILGVRRDPSMKLDLEFPSRCHKEVYDYEIPRTALPHGTKYLYIESSYGLSQFVDTPVVYVPMWEQGSTIPECTHASKSGDTIVAVTRKTEQRLPRFFPIYLPWPVEIPQVQRCISTVRTILHNAGSLGGNLRKGTLEAIRIFQRSNVARQNTRLVIHSWMQPTKEIVNAIAVAPRGIEWTGKFFPKHDDVYNAVDADLLLMPSKIEGHALVALEAMARGIPALVTDVAPINEYEEDLLFRLPAAYEEPSPLAEPYQIVDVEEGAERLRALCDKNLAKKSLEVRDFVEKKMSWDALGAAWRELCT